MAEDQDPTDNKLGPTKEELALFDEISRMAANLLSKSKKIAGLNTDPKMFSIMLFRRLWSNHKGYTLLWKNELALEGDIILRSGVETAICIAANLKLQDEFIELMRSDAASTLQGQIKAHRDMGELDMVRDGELTLRMLLKRIPAGSKAKRLDWKSLAEAGGVPQLYGWHRMLSGVSSHVTGLSVLPGVVSTKKDEDNNQLLEALRRKMHLMMMAGATLNGSMYHAGMIDDEAEVRNALVLTERMNAISFKWPGVIAADRDSDPKEQGPE